VGDGADVLHQLGLGHADAVVGDGESFRVLVSLDADFKGRVVGLGVGGGYPQLVQRVRGVGDEFAQEDFALGVQGVDEDIEQLLDFGLEFVGSLCGHGWYLLDAGLSSHKAPRGAGPWQGMWRIRVWPAWGVFPARPGRRVWLLRLGFK